MKVCVSGKARVEVEYDQEGRTHRASAPGVYRARVFFRDELIDTLLVGCPKFMANDAMSDSAVTSIAKAAIHFSTGDKPEMENEVERDESGALIVRSQLQSEESVVPSVETKAEPSRKRARRNPRIAL